MYSYFSFLTIYCLLIVNVQVPAQNDIHTCGYYIMRYMKEIVEDKELSFASKVLNYYFVFFVIDSKIWTLLIA